MKTGRLGFLPGLMVASVLIGTLESMATLNGILRKNPANTRYFTDDTGKAVYLTGAHTWANLQDGWLLGHGDPPPPFDFDGYLDAVEANNQNFIRLWCNELPKVDFTSECGRVYYPTPSAWQRTGPGTANDGKPKFNLELLNQAYFDRLLARVTAAKDKGIYVGIMLFEGYSIRKKTGTLGWNYSPFHYNNNINAIDGDPNRNGCGIESHTLLASTNLTNIQKAYIKKVIDTVNHLDNVLYEISNEEGNLAGGTTSRDWQYHLMEFIRDYERTQKPKQHPVMISCIYNANNTDGWNTWVTNSAADCIAPYGAGTLDGANNHPSPITSAGGANDKVVFADTDHIFGVDGNYDWVWKVFTRGYNALFMDAWVNNDWIWTPPATYNRDTANAAMGATLAYARKMDLVSMTPQTALASTAYCLANAGVEYLVYQPGAGNVTVNSLIAGTYTFEWVRPDTGAFDRSGNITVPAGSWSFTPPFTPAVLYLKVVATNQVAPPSFSPAGESFYDSTTALLSCGTDGSVIRYTTDGSEPDATSTLYEGPVLLTASVTLKAKGFKDGLLDSNTIGANFIKLSRSGILIQDNFTDGNPATITGGTGIGWNIGNFNGAPRPTESNGTFNAAMARENGIGSLHGKDVFTFWDEDGLTATWVIKSMTVQTPHAYGYYLAYCWEMGIVSYNNNNNAASSYCMSGPNTHGGFYIQIGKKDAGNKAEIWVTVSNKSYSGVEGTSGFITPTQTGTFPEGGLGPVFTATFPLTVTATLTSNGWSVAVNGLAAPISGNWTSSLIKPGNNASITDEFRNGAFVFIGGRNHGIVGGTTFSPENHGSMESVTITRNASTTVEAPTFSPAPNIFGVAPDVTIGTPTEGATLYYTTNGAAPDALTGLVYTGPVNLPRTTLLRAVACKSGMTDSAVSSGTYIVQTGPFSNNVVNGSFEFGTSGWAVASNNGLAAAYTVTNNQGTTNGSYALALGSQNAAGNAIFAQTLATVPGENVAVRFCYAAYGAAGKAQVLRAEALDGATVLTSLVVTAFGSGIFTPAGTRFVEYTLAFTAASAATTLRFTDQTLPANSGSCDGMLDMLYAIQSAPPSSNGLVNGGFESGTNGWAVSSRDASPARYAVNGSEGRADGTNALILGNVNSVSGNTEFAQALTTISGAVYKIRFSYGAFGNGNRTQSLRSEALNGTTLLARLDVTAVETTPAGNFNPAKVVFRTHTNTFTAAASSTRIYFTDRTATSAGNDCDGVLDNVSVTCESSSIMRRGSLMILH